VSDLVNYVVWQLPGWVLVGAGLVLLHMLLGLPLVLVAVVFALFVAKDLLLFPALRTIFRPARGPIPVGARGETVEALRPVGYVRVNGELWRARTRRGGLPAGRPVIVRAASGLTLIVEEAPRGALIRALARPPGRDRFA
jgi:membrane protein implicated in regulation of membrane protease activity